MVNQIPPPPERRKASAMGTTTCTQTQYYFNYLSAVNMEINTQNALSERDLKVVWHPCTQMQDHENVPLIPIKTAQGVWLEDFNGKRYLDAISSWWVNLFGHNHPHITKAIQDQVSQLSHVIFAGFTHEPAIQLAEQLIALSPTGLTHCFYADNGSSAIEAALKMSFHFWANSGNTHKTKFIHLSNSYHGETLGALAVGDMDLYKKTYRPLLMQSIVVPSPDCYDREENETWLEYTTRMFAHMEQALAQHADEVCAVIIEPLVQCAGNMRMYHPIYLSLLREACDRYNVHLIADEIAVGFGRTGTLFACEQANITPDFLCLSKGITGGYLPLSVVLTRDNIYQAFYAEYHQFKAFLHSHSYTGNALACSAALANLEIFSKEPVLENNRVLSGHLAKACAQFQDHPYVAEIRQTGMIVAVEMVKNKKTKTPFSMTERKGLSVYLSALRQGALLRPLGNVVYFMPPYVISPDEIDQMVKMAYQAINEATLS